MEGAAAMEPVDKKASPAVLFVSWQGGLGYIMRDIAIARELRAVRPNVRIDWLAHPLAGRVLLEEDETPMPESARSADYNEIGAAKALDGFRLSLAKYVYHGRKAWRANALLFEEVTKNQHLQAPGVAANPVRRCPHGSAPARPDAESGSRCPSAGVCPPSRAAVIAVSPPLAS